MLEILKDVTIRHDGREIKCKAGQIVNVKSAFDVNDERSNGIEKRYADKFREFVKIKRVAQGTKTDSPNPSPIHNEIEQEKRKKDKEALEPIDEEPKDEEPKQEKKKESKKKKK